MVQRKKAPATSADNLGSVLSTLAGPSTAPAPQVAPGTETVAPELIVKAAATGALAGAMPVNTNKPFEHGDAARQPRASRTQARPSSRRRRWSARAPCASRTRRRRSVPAWRLRA